MLVFILLTKHGISFQVSIKINMNGVLTVFLQRKAFNHGNNLKFKYSIILDFVYVLMKLGRLIVFVPFHVVYNGTYLLVRIYKQ